MKDPFYCITFAEIKGESMKVRTLLWKTISESVSKSDVERWENNGDVQFDRFENGDKK